VFWRSKSKAVEMPPYIDARSPPMEVCQPLLAADLEVLSATTIDALSVPLYAVRAQNLMSAAEPTPVRQETAILSTVHFCRSGEQSSTLGKIVTFLKRTGPECAHLRRSGVAGAEGWHVFHHQPSIEKTTFASTPSAAGLWDSVSTRTCRSVEHCADQARVTKSAVGRLCAGCP
jgi:hypothetical protein